MYTYPTFFATQKAGTSGELRGSQLAFVPIRWDMPCRIDRSRDLRSQRRTQGVASLYPGLSHFAPLGRGDRRIAEPKSLFDYRKSNLLDVAGERERGLVVW